MRKENSKTTLLNNAYKAPQRISSDDEVIYEAPEGETVSYSTSGTAYIAIMGYVGTMPVENFVTDIVYCEDGVVYWKNSITAILANTYIKGKDEGDRLVFELPQALLSNPQEPDEQGNPTLAYVQRMTYNEEDQFYYVNEENQTVTLIKNEDGSLSGDVDGNDILGMTTPDGRWYGYGNYNIVLAPDKGLEVVTPPEGLKTEEWMFISNYVGRKVELGFDGNDLYLHNPVRPSTDDPGLLPDYWIKGSIENGEITIPTQYIGSSDFMLVSIYFTPLNYDGDETVEKFDEAVLTYDAEAKIMVSDVGFGLMAGPGYLFGYSDAPTIRWQPEDLAINLPNPVILDAFNFDTTINYGVCAFELAPVNDEGYTLDANYIFCRLYVDGEPYTFDADDYMKLEDSMEWVPFLYDDGWDFHQDGDYHRFDIYFDGAETMGVQAKYDDGKNLFYTDIVTVSLEGDAVETIDANIEGDIINAEESVIYSINGTKSDKQSLAPGIYIVRNSKVTKKLIVK
ncbi:MAG: T9SS type A sorting domain-containing protein [Muribaculaceae bacterium]|nr:T9SS type A sorting domain-containing protein [Muribaculaceae bacterium]